MSTHRAPAVKLFAPERWGQVELFSKLCAETYKFSEREQRALTGIAQHFEKAATFQRLAVKVKPGLTADQAELNERGYTTAPNSRELTTLIEAAILEIYSSVDCTAKVLRAIYGQTSRGFKNSTRSLFKSFDSISGTFPNSIKEIFRKVTWYDELLFLRDELAHLGTGWCHLDEAKTKVKYMHVGVKTKGKPLIIEDVFTWLSNLVNVVNSFLGQIFQLLRGSLKNTPVPVVCGIVEARFLIRYVDPTQEITFASGRCASYQWFEQLDAPTCPFVAHCGAYMKTRPNENPAALMARKS